MQPLKLLNHIVMAASKESVSLTFSSGRTGGTRGDDECTHVSVWSYYLTQLGRGGLLPGRADLIPI